MVTMMHMMLTMMCVMITRVQVVSHGCVRHMAGYLYGDCSDWSKVALF